MTSFDRLIDLARKTGDKLIVHDPTEDRDVVIMGVGQYESLVEDRMDYNDVHGLSSEQLLNQINRDIAIWRADKDMEDNLDQSYGIPFGPHSDSFFDPHKPISESWHEARNVLEDRFGDMNLDPLEDPLSLHNSASDDFSENNDEDSNVDFNQNLLDNSFSVEDFSPETEWDLPKNKEDRLDYVPTSGSLGMSPPSLDWEEEPLSDDEPIFLEEPIQF